MKKNRNAERRRREDRGAEGAEGDGVWGGGVPLPNGEGSGEGAVPPPQNFVFDFRPGNSVFGAFWALYFTIQLPALRTESGYIHVADRYV